MTSSSSRTTGSLAAPQRGCLPGGRGPGPWGRMVDGIASKLAFFPPTPASYRVEEHKDGTGQLYIQPVDRWAPRCSSIGSVAVATNSTLSKALANQGLLAVLPQQDCVLWAAPQGRMLALSHLCSSVRPKMALCTAASIYTLLPMQLCGDALSHQKLECISMAQYKGGSAHKCM